MSARPPLLPFRRLLGAVPLLATLAAAPLLADPGAPAVPGELAWPQAQAKAAPAWRAPGAAVAVLTLGRLDPARVEAVQAGNRAAGLRRIQVGLHRALAGELASGGPDLTWQVVAGGRVARIEVVDPGALGLRVALRGDRLPAGVELRVAGSGRPESVYAVEGGSPHDQLDGWGRYWTDATDGDRQLIELFAPHGVEVASLGTGVVAAVSHLLVAPQSDAALVGKALGDSGSCNINVACRVDQLGATFVVAKNAVSRMLFESGGGTFTCTGTLLNDQDTSTQIPWYFTAHHCIGNQAEASTLRTFWQYESPSCNTVGAGANVQVGGGAQLLYSQAGTDAALLRLNGTVPGGTGYAGWSAAALQANTPVVAIHHPSGDAKKYSRGNHSGHTANVNIEGQVVASAARASWTEGTTEGGSSGSGLFTWDAASYYLRGGLFGGGASCANTGQSEAAGNRDFYSRFDQVYPSIQSYLTGTGGTPPGPTRDHTGQWDVATEGGRGLSIFQFPAPGNTLFVLWFVYDSQGRASWYQLDPSWTGQNVASGRVVRWTGPPWGPTYNPANRSFVETGSFTLNFTSAGSATFSYNVDGVNRTVTLQKL
ncbi:MAG: trypsin-like peptidase domain-containing protein [Xanthomonadales bacterium]|nr:trypsin-like peptidase domain-containing protein [Xanthomonadales bacterium]